MRKNAVLASIIMIMCLTICACSSKPDSGDGDKLYVIFTVDVEDNRGNEPHLIEGDLREFEIQENCGVDYIMDTFEKYNSKAVFFVNIYENSLYDESYMPSLLRRMNDRGHEVGLHSHSPSDSSMDFYQRGLSQYDLGAQKKILSYGKDYIYSAINKYPVSYRAGAYSINDETFKALSETGFLIDSSVYYGHENNLITEEKKNQVFSIEECIEFPVEVIFNGSSWRKFDIDSLSEDEIYATLDYFKESKKYNAVQIMFHSFSFMDLKGGEGKEVLLQDGNKSIYGENFDTKKKLNDILNYLSDSEEYQVVTFEEYLSLGLEIPEYVDDNLIYLSNKDLAYEREDIEVTADGNTLFMNNKLEGETLMYAWQIYNADNQEEKYSSAYNSSGKYGMIFPEDATGLYYVKSYVKGSDDEKVSATYYKVNVINGKIESVDIR